MRKLYMEYFHIPKHGKIREKVMFARVIATVCLMVALLAAASITAYAYFSYNVTSGSNTIKAANFEADVSITISDQNNETVTVTEISSIQYSAVLQKGKTYSVTLTPGENSTATTGFCAITADGCANTYHTQQLGADTTAAGGKTESITFTLTVSDDTTVYILAHWGTSSHYDAYQQKGDNDELYIINNEMISLVVNGQTNSISESNEDETEPDSTETAETIYTVESGDTLSAIAVAYDTTVERIVAYNDLANPDSLQVGQQLKIPPADWQIPESTTEQTTTTTTQEETTTTDTTTTTETTGTTETTQPTDTTTPSETTETTPVESTTTETETTDGETEPTETITSTEETQPTAETTNETTTEENE